MALTRKLLKGMGLTDEQVDTIIEAHTDTVDGLKADVTKYKGNAEKLPGVQKELDDLKAAGDGGWEQKAKDWEKKYTDLVTENKNKETHANKASAYRQLLKDAGIAEKYIDKVLKLCDVDAAELVDGKIKDAAAITETVKKDFDVFISTESIKGADTHNPQPGAGAGGEEDYSKYESMSIEEYIASRTPKSN